MTDPKALVARIDERIGALRSAVSDAVGERRYSLERDAALLAVCRAALVAAGEDAERLDWMEGHALMNDGWRGFEVNVDGKEIAVAPGPYVQGGLRAAIDAARKGGSDADRAKMRAPRSAGLADDPSSREGPGNGVSPQCERGSQPGASLDELIAALTDELAELRKPLRRLTGEEMGDLLRSLGDSRKASEVGRAVESALARANGREI